MEYEYKLYDRMSIDISVMECLVVIYVNIYKDTCSGI